MAQATDTRGRTGVGGGKGRGRGIIEGRLLSRYLVMGIYVNIYLECQG
jgi:hypothetical protein